MLQSVNRLEQAFRLFGAVLFPCSSLAAAVRTETCPSAILCTINPAWSGLGLDPAIRDESLAIDHTALPCDGH